MCEGGEGAACRGVGMESDVAALSAGSASEAAAALDSLSAQLLDSSDEADQLLDAHSFELFEPCLTLASRGRERRHAKTAAQAERILAAIARAANPREVLLMVLGALSTHPRPMAQCCALSLLPAVLPRLRRRRVEMLTSCLGALADRFLAPGAWSASEWDDQEGGEESDRQEDLAVPADNQQSIGDTLVGGCSALSSHLLMPLLVDCAASICPATTSEGSAPIGFASAFSIEDDAERSLWTRFLLYIIERAGSLGDVTSGARACELLSTDSPSLLWLHGETPHSFHAEQSIAGDSRVGNGNSTRGRSKENAGASHNTEVARHNVLVGPQPLGASLYAHWLVTVRSLREECAMMSVSPVAVAGPDALSTESKMPGPIAASRIFQPLTPRVASQIAALAHTLLTGPASVRQRGRELLEWLIQATGMVEPGGARLLLSKTTAGTSRRAAISTIAEGRFASISMAACAEALVVHMATAVAAPERSAGYKILQRLLDLWAAAPRFDLLVSLLEKSKPHPKATALLLHRLKEELLAERKVGMVSSGEGTADGARTPARSIVSACVFGPAALLVPIRIVLQDTVTAAASGHNFPLESQLDAVMGALNLLRFLIADALSSRQSVHGSIAESEVLTPSLMRQLKADVLQHLDKRLREDMDMVWAEIQVSNNAGPRNQESDKSDRSKIAFTQLQVTLVTLERVLELSAEMMAVA